MSWWFFPHLCVRGKEMWGCCNPYPHLCQQLDTGAVPHGSGFLQQSVFTTCGGIHSRSIFPPIYQICFHSKSFHSVTWYPSSRWLVSVEGSCHSAQDSSPTIWFNFSPHTEQTLHGNLSQCEFMQQLVLTTCDGINFWSIPHPPPHLSKYAFTLINPTKWAGLSVLKDNATYAQDSEPRIELKFAPWWHGD